MTAIKLNLGMLCQKGKDKQKVYTHNLFFKNIITYKLIYLKSYKILGFLI